jgi:hypothetical protein
MTGPSRDEQVEALFPIEGPHGDDMTRAAARSIAGLVRYLNHVTWHDSAIPYLSTVDSLGRSLSAAMAGLDHLLRRSSITICPPPPTGPARTPPAASRSAKWPPSSPTTPTTHGLPTPRPGCAVAGDRVQQPPRHPRRRRALHGADMTRDHGDRAPADTDEQPIDEDPHRRVQNATPAHGSNGWLWT